MKKVGIIGGGLMGSEIGYVVASKLLEVKVIINDISNEILLKSKNKIEGVGKKAVERAKAKEEEVKEWLSRIEYTTNIDNVSDSEIVIEAVNENIELKRKIFAQLDSLCNKDTILATNTSSLAITSIASATKRADKVIGLHFFNPASIMRLVEIINGYDTSHQTFEKSKKFCLDIGKEVISAKDVPGFITSRVGVMLMNEAIHALYEGIGSPEDIDKGIKLGYNHPMGPLELADLVGLDTILSVLNTLYNGYQDTKYRPCVLLKQMVEAGHLGRKTGRGFYDYTKK